MSEGTDSISMIHTVHGVPIHGEDAVINPGVKGEEDEIRKIHDTVSGKTKTKENIAMLSAESQKGIDAVQRCSVENQKGAIAIDFVQ